MFTQGVSLMNNELNFKNITCDACGSTCKNIELDIFKNGYYVFIGSNENFEDADLFNDTYRTCITMLDNKNVIAACDDLGILPNIADLQSLFVTKQNLIDVPDTDKDTDEYKLKLIELTNSITSIMKK